MPFELSILRFSDTTLEQCPQISECSPLRDSPIHNQPNVLRGVSCTQKKINKFFCKGMPFGLCLMDFSGTALKIPLLRAGSRVPVRRVN